MCKEGRLFFVKLYLNNIQLETEVRKEGQPKYPPVIEKIGKPPPLHRRAKRGDKILGFFREFSGKFREFSGIFP